MCIYQQVYPPSTHNAEPVVKEEASLARYTIAPPSSSGSPGRDIGDMLIHRLTMLPFSSNVGLVIAVIIYPGAIGLAKNVVAEDNTAAIRIPHHEFCSQLIYKFRKPIVSTSANISGEKAPAFYLDIAKEIISAVDWVADPVFEADSTGKPSSIIKLGLGGEVEIIRK